MNRFGYTATKNNSKSRGEVEAHSFAHAYLQLQNDGFTSIQCYSVDTRPWKLFALNLLSRKNKKLGHEQVIAFTRQLSNLTRGGMELDKAMDFLSASHRDSQVISVLKGINLKIKEGQSLAAAFSEHSQHFPAYYSAMLEAGHAAGNLPKILEEMAELMERRHGARRQIISALVYPCILIATSVLAIFILTSTILPQFEIIFTSSNVEIPRALVVLSFVGKGLGIFIVAFFLACIVATIAVVSKGNDEEFKTKLHKLLVRAPIIRSFIKKNNLEMYCRSLKMLLAGGIDFSVAMKISENSISNLYIRGRFSKATETVKGGYSLSSALSQHGDILPDYMVTMLRVGERSNSLGEVLAGVASTLSKEVDDSIRSFLNMLTPAVTLIMGGVVASIIIVILSAIFGLNDLVLGV